MSKVKDKMSNLRKKNSPLFLRRKESYNVIDPNQGSFTYGCIWVVIPDTMEKTKTELFREKLSAYGKHITKLLTVDFPKVEPEDSGRG